jgi:LacI family transcriptional regulator
MAERITLKDIARQVGLSISGVSLALRADPRVPAETVRRVREAADELGYVQNLAAANLRTSRSDTIAVCLGDLSNPIFNDILIRAEEEIDRRGKRMMLGVSREDIERQDDFIRQALRMGAEALLLCPAYDTTADILAKVLLRDGKPRLPTALLFRSIDGFPCPQVASDEVEAGRIAGRLALRSRHRRFVWLGGGSHTSVARDRQFGALEILDHGQTEQVTVINGPTSRKFGYEATHRILTEDPDGDLCFLCFSDLIALGALSACHALGKPVGEAVSVIGCDDMDEVKYSVPPLSTVHIDIPGIVQIGMKAALDGGTASRTTLAPTLKERKSVRP